MPQPPDMPITWKKADVIANWLGSLAQSLIGILGLILTMSVGRFAAERQEHAEQVRINQDRETSVLATRANIFPAVVDRLLNHKMPVLDRIRILETFQHNFLDTFNGRAFFEDLAADADSQRNMGALKELLRVASETNQRQVETLVAASGSGVSTSWVYSHGTSGKASHFPLFTLNEGQSVDVTIADGEEEHRLRLVLRKVISSDAIDVALTVFSGQMRNSEPDVHEFEASLYDTPLTDHLLLPDGHFVAVTLQQVEAHRATFRIIHFPDTYIPDGYRPPAEVISRVANEVKVAGR